MRRILPPTLTLFVLPLLPISPAIADERIDLLLEEIRALHDKVDSLESRLAALEGPRPSTSSATLRQAPASLREAQVQEEPAVEERERRTWLDSMRRDLRRSEALASGAWTDPEIWTYLKEGMTKEEAVELLGDPTRVRFSVRKDTDEILHYEGDLAGTGEPVTGEVRIYRGKVARFDIPNFP